MRIALAVMMLTACDGGPVATTDPLARLVRVEPPRADEALTIVVRELEREIGATMPPVRVTWVAERIPYGDVTVIGLHRGCGDIWVTWWEGPRLHQLALAHEVGHCARVVAGLDSDPTHEDAMWWAKDGAGVVDRVNRQLAGAGL